jgi:fatty acid-binding protein DegV
MAQDKQAALKERIEKELGLNVVEFWIGPIIGTSCGPGVVGCWFLGKKVEFDSQGK